MNQIDIFPPAVHLNDPLSSYQAEARVTKSGKRKSNYIRILAILAVRYNITAAELADEHAFDPVEVRRRLSDARAKGDAEQTGQRKCRVAGTLAVTWRKVDKYK